MNGSAHAHLHDSLTVHTKILRALLLHLQGRQGQWSPSARWLILHFRHHRFLGEQTALVQYRDCHAIKEMMSIPVEIDADVVMQMHDLDSPERLGHKVLDSKVPVDNESQRGKLAGPLEC